MSTKKTTEATDLKLANESAAHTLLVQFIKDNANHLANSLRDLIPFLVEETGIDMIRGDISVVNLVFATTALQVIKSHSAFDPDTDEGEPLQLPIDASKMQGSVFSLTELVQALDGIARFLEVHRENPAIRMAVEAYGGKQIYC